MNVRAKCGCWCAACLTGVHQCIYPACSLYVGLGLVGPWPKRCACGTSYDEKAWAKLKSLGTFDDGKYDMRNCIMCGSTLAQEIETAPQGE